MKLTYNIPENKSDISLVKFLEIEKLYKDAEENETEVNEKKIISVCLDIPYHYVDRLPFEEYQLAVESITKALSSESTFYQRFEYKGIEFGFIPDLEKITVGEFAALDMFMKEPQKNALEIINVLYRPITDEVEYTNWWSKKTVKKYTIESYDEDDREHGEKVDVSFFKDVPYEIYEGAMVFFLQFRKTFTSRYTEVYESGGSEDDRARAFGKKWGWFQTLDTYAKATNINPKHAHKELASEVLLRLAFESDKAKLMKPIKK